MPSNLLRFTHRRRATRFETWPIRFAVAALATLLVAGCVGETYTRGQKITADQLEQVPVGSSREQAVLALGTPTVTGLSSGEVLYYISQTTGRSLAFQKTSVKDRRILAVYFDEEGNVRQIAEYGLKDGRVFDYLSRKTRTSGEDLAFVGQLLAGVLNPSL